MLRRRWQRALAVLPALIALIVTFGCSRTPGPTITAVQAEQRVDEHLRRTLREVSTTLRFSKDTLPDFERESGSSCTRPMEGSGFTGQVKVTVRYTAEQSWPRDTPTPAVVTAFLDAVRSQWGGTIETRPITVIVTENLDDGYSAYAEYRFGRVHLAGSSRCVWPSGTPERD